MFTGIVEEQGTVQSVKTQGETIKLNIFANKILEDVNLGDSINVNGVCLTVTNFNKHSFQADVMPETFNTTSLVQLNKDSFVNLERAMAANGRFGGHFVSGHVDCTGKIIKKEKYENAIYLDIQYKEEFGHLLLDKGSVAVDGTSLTIFGKKDNHFTISLIPHTSENSLLGKKLVGDLVNIEFDLIGKYLDSYLSKTEEATSGQERISKEFLTEHGFN
jgi:riboflavin synthase